MPSVSVIIPAGGTDPHRVMALQRVWDFYLYEFPDWYLAAGLDRPTGDVFSRARAVNNGFHHSYGDIIVINDADTLCPPWQVASAVAMAHAQPGLVRAYTRYRRLSREATEACATYKEVLAADDSMIEWQQDVAYAHGCVAVRRECFEQVGGYDPKFQGWGMEDMAAELLYDAHWPDRRVEGDLLHMWHPNAQDPGDEDQKQNEDLYYKLYEPLRGDAVGLRAARELERWP